MAPTIRSGDSQNFFATATVEELQAFVSAGFKIHFCTQGPDTLLYVPPMSIVSERVVGPSEFVGIRVGVMLRAPPANFRLALSDMLNEIDATKGNVKPYKQLQALCELACEKDDNKQGDDKDGDGAKKENEADDGLGDKNGDGEKEDGDGTEKDGDQGDGDQAGTTDGDCQKKDGDEREGVEAGAKGGDGKEGDEEEGVDKE